MADSRMDEKLDGLSEKLSNIEVCVAINTADLRHHIARTDLLQKQVDSIWPKVLMTLSILSGLAVLAKQLL